MIIVDFNQIVIGNFMALSKAPKFNRRGVGFTNNAYSGPVNVDMARHIVLNTLRDIRSRHKKSYGELVISCDGRNYWRKKEFPFYKGLRAAGREAIAKSQDIDWSVLFDALNTIRDELRAEFPYKVLCIDTAESDDIIASIIKYKQANELTQTGFDAEPEPILIVSSDHDFRQLQVYSNVRQWSPSTKKLIEEKNPTRYLKEHILRGDAGDGVPNVLSVDKSFIDKIRQKQLRQDKVDEWIKYDKPEDFLTPEQVKNYNRNRTLCDLVHCVPADLEACIIEEYKKPAQGARRNLLMYFAKHRMKNLMSSISDF